MTATDWITALSSALTALATVGLVWGAVVAWRTAKKTLDQMKDDSRDQTRPYVFAKLEPSMGGGHVWDLVIKNTGATAARDLTITSSSWPDGEDNATSALKRMFRTPQTLPPGTSIRTYWNLDPMGKDDGQTAGVVEPVTIHLKYKGVDPEGHAFEDHYRLDHTALGLTPMGWKGPERQTDRGEFYELDQRLRDLIHSVSELRRNL